MVKKRKRKDTLDNKGYERSVEEVEFSSNQNFETSLELDNVNMMEVDDLTNKSAEIDNELVENIAQQWLDEKYPKGKKEEITEIGEND